MRYVKDPNIMFGCAFSILGIYVVNQASKWTIYGHDGPDAGFFPIIYGLIMLAVALPLTFNSIRARRSAAIKAVAPPEQGGTMAAAATWGALAASVPLIWALGFVVGFGLVLFFIIMVVFERPVLNAAIIAIVIALALHFTFTDLLLSPLPASPVWGF